MEVFEPYLVQIKDINKQKIVRELLEYIIKKNKNLTPKIAWNQPMFTYKNTFILGLSVSKNHISIAPEQVVIEYFSHDIIKAGYDHTKMLFRIQFNEPINYVLIDKIIEFNMEDKKNCTTFWRK